MESSNNNSNSQWSFIEWEKMRERLEKLSLDQLRLLATRTGIEFEGGNETVKDREQISAKEQFLMVLDEADREKLQAEYDKITKADQMS